MGARKMFVWMWVIAWVICISVIAGGCAMPTSNAPTTPGPTQAPTGSAAPIQPLATPSDLLPSTSSSAISESYGLTPVAVGSKYGYIDSTGKLIINPQFDDARYFSEGFAAVRIGSQETGKWGFIDQSGKFVINPQFDFPRMVSSFSEGLAWVKVGDKYGYIDKTGKLVINPQFDYAWPFSDGLAAVNVGGKYGYIDNTGNFVINPQFDWFEELNASFFSEGLAAVNVGGKYGYIDKAGSFIINPQFEGAGDFSEGLAWVWVGRKFGCIDKTGSYIINPQFDVAWPFFEGLARVSVGDKYGYIDKIGHFIINPQFDFSEGIGSGFFSEGLARVQVGDKYGYIDKTGSYVINLQFDWATDFSEGLARVQVGGKYGYIDKTPGGHFVWNPDNIQLASEPSSQPSLPGPTIPTTQASPGTQSKDAQVAAIANALVEAFNTTDPEPLAQYAKPYSSHHDSLFGRIEVQMYNNIAIEGYKSRPVWKAGTVKLVEYYLDEIAFGYSTLYVKMSGTCLGDPRVVEYRLQIEDQNGQLYVIDLF